MTCLKLNELNSIIKISKTNVKRINEIQRTMKVTCLNFGRESWCPKY